MLLYTIILYMSSKVSQNIKRTLGYTNLDICFRSEVRTVEFQFVGSEFAIPHEGILCKPFIIGQAVIINYKTSELIFTDQSEVTLQPRAETLFAVDSSRLAENSNILIDKQNITEAITCGNCVTTVRNHSVLVSFINTTENSIQITIPKLDQFIYEEFNEASIHAVQIQDHPEPKADSNKIIRLQEALRLDHLNTEEKSSLLSICN